MLLAVAAPALAPAATTVTTDNVTARLVAERGVVSPGEAVDLALVLDIRDGWHTYWRNPGDSGEPPRIDWRLPAGVEAGPIRWPLPERIPVGPLANYGYSGRAVHLVGLRLSDDWPVGEPVEIAAEARWLVCEEACIPEQGRFALTLGTAPLAGPANSDVADIFASARAALPAAASVPARLQRDGDLLRLAVPMEALPAAVSPSDPAAIDTVEFFPATWGLIEHAAEQPWRLQDTELMIDLVAGSAVSGAEHAGLLVVEAAGERRGVHVDAGLAPTGEPPVAADASLGLASAMLLALLGGIILNLMPCVFPVLAIKALGFAGQGGAPVRERALHGLAYTAGVLTFFAVVAALLLTLRAAGVAVGWGFQLQSPLFVASMAYLFLLLGLALAGAVTIGAGLMGIGEGLAGRGRQAVGTGARAHTDAFATGGLAALVAAPCTAPFMGAALGYAVTLAWLPALVIVLTLGLGMALPFLLLTLIPGLGERLPRPGPWMERLKQLLAFPMFATAAWLVWVLSVQAGPDGVASVLAGMLLIALSLWALEQTRLAGAGVRRAAGTAAVIGIGLALWLGAALEMRAAPSGAAGLADRPESSLSAVAYSEEALSGAVASGRPVFVNMTAAWCITCLVNERVALSGSRLARAFEQQDVLYLKGDWTNRDPDITRYLAGFGRNGVPIYVFYPPGGEPEVLPQLLTESIVLAVVGEDT